MREMHERQPQRYDPRAHEMRVRAPAPVQPYVAPKSTAAGLFLGLLPPCGIGCMYAGRAGIGVLLMAVWLVSVPLVLAAGIGIVTGFGAWVASAVLGYTMTREWNAARGIVS